MSKGLLICSDCLTVYSVKRNHCPNCKSKASTYLGIFSNLAEAQKVSRKIGEIRSGVTEENIASQ